MAKKITDMALMGRLKLEEETLTDGSKVYNVWVNNIEITCEDLQSANTLYDLLDNGKYYYEKTEEEDN